MLPFFSCMESFTNPDCCEKMGVDTFTCHEFGAPLADGWTASNVNCDQKPCK